MSTIAATAGQLELKEIQEYWEKQSPATREGVIVFSALLLVTLLILVWAIFFRKSGRPRRSRHSRALASRAHDHNPAPPKADRSSSAGDSALPRESRKERRRRRARRPLNPTLAQTGGLPPIRGEDTSQTS